MPRRILTVKNLPSQGVPVDTVVERICENCRFLDMQEFKDSTCRRRPPFHMQDGNGSWPSVRHDDWCGDFKRLPLKESPYNE